MQSLSDLPPKTVAAALVVSWVFQWRPVGALQVNVCFPSGLALITASFALAATLVPSSSFVKVKN